MNEFQLALLIGALVVLVASWRLPRARHLLVLGALSFVASTAYARYDLPYPPAFSIACDAFVCLWIYHTATEEFELWVWRAFQGMVLVNLLFLVGVIGPHSAYVQALELLNWAALAIIGGTALVEGLKGYGGNFGGGWARLLLYSRRSLRAQRTSDPWHKVTK